MKYSIILSPLIISICILNVYVAPTGSSRLEEFMFLDNDEQGIASGITPANLNHDKPTPFDIQASSIIMRPHESTKSESLPSKWTLEELENTFINMYSHYNKSISWNWLKNDDPHKFSKICTKVWKNSSGKLCAGIEKPFGRKGGSPFKVVFPETNYRKSIRTDFLLCRCWPVTMSKHEARIKIEPILLAAYNDSHVFLLDVHSRKSHTMKIYGITSIDSVFKKS